MFYCLHALCLNTYAAFNVYDHDIYRMTCTLHPAASQPAPYAIDNAYWSKMPKLINVAKDRSSLGITLVTREVSTLGLWSPSLVVYMYWSEEIGHDHVHHFFAELAQLIDMDFLCKLLAGVARSLETEGKS